MIGSALVIGVIASIPLFSNGILQRALTRDLEQHQIDRGVFPGYIILQSQLARDEDRRAQQSRSLARFANEIPSRLDMPLTARVHSIKLEGIQLVREGELRNYPCRLVFQNDLENHIDLIYGRMFDLNPDPATGEIEVIVTEALMQQNRLVIDNVYTINNANYQAEAADLLKIRVVGVFEPRSQDSYWQSIVLNDSFFVPYGSFENFIDHPVKEIMSESYLLVFNYRGIRIEQVNHISATYAVIEREIEARFDTFTQTPLRTTFISVIENFTGREENLRLVLQLLNIPVLLMLFYYIFMIAKLKLSDEESFIAVIRSRGTSGWQIFLLYLLEAVIIGILAIALGLPLGWGICRILGSSNGFLDFVSRAALPLRITQQVIQYSIVAFLCIVITAVVPALSYSRSSIVEQKRKSARPKKPLWKRLFLDVVLLGLSLYYLYILREQTEFFQTIGMGGTDINIDLPLYFVSTIFTIGAGLFFLRVYPWLVTLVYIIGRRFWSPASYAAFHTIKKSGGTGNFVMLFIIIALSVGLFNAGAARTINRNIEDRIRNAIGADIVTRQYWTELDERGNPYIHSGSYQVLQGGASPSTGPVIYMEPPYIDFKMLEGVESVARVLQYNNARVRMSSAPSTLGTSMRASVSFLELSLIAFDPYDFAKTAWWRQDMAPFHINEYMNVMMDYPNGVILSESLRDLLKITEGSIINVRNLHRNERMNFYVLAFVDHWPSFAPFSEDSTGMTGGRDHFIAANLEYIFSQVPRHPYNVWIQKSPGVSDAEIYDQLEKMEIPFRSIESVTDHLTKSKNDPVIQGTNGAMSLGFIIAMVICAMGFLIYWILSINSRMLQFGIMRAMGFTRWKILRMLIYEQILVSGTAFFTGMIIGNLAVIFYVPLFSLLYTGNEHNVPFKIFLSSDDSLIIYTIFGVAILCCLMILGNILRRINIAKVIKFGED